MACLQVWAAVNRLPTQISEDYAEQRRIQTRFLEVRRDLNATSSQDEFAKWAKLRRQHDKLLELLEKKSTYSRGSRRRAITGNAHILTARPFAPSTTETSIDARRTKLMGFVATARWLSTRGVQFLLPFWYAKTPMFWLPHGWFPYYAEWIVSFPRAPLGSVSIASWQVACTGVIRLLSDTVAAVLAFVRSSRQRAGTEKAQPVKMAAAGAGQGKASSEAESKKEL